MISQRQGRFILKAASRLGYSQKHLYYRWQRRFGRVVFIHINKCGGTSIEAALGIPKKIHDTAVRRREMIGGARWDACFTFSFVRHPFARVSSDYHHRVATNQNGLGENPIGFNAWIARAYGEKDPAYYTHPLMFAPCRDWLCDAEGTILVDYVGKLETIEQDWEHVQRRLGIRRALPRKNVGQHPGSGTPPISTGNKALLRAHFKADFDMFYPGEDG
jgi:hypothetical protein